MAECWRLAPPEALNKKTMMSASMRHPSFTPSSSSDNHNLNQPLIAFANHPYAFDTSSLQHPIEQPSIPRTTSYCMSAPSAFTTTAYDTTSRDFAFRPDTHLAAVTSAQDWQMYQTSMGVPVVAHSHGLKRVGSSQNIPTESPVQSTDHVSPFTHSAAFPQIANTEFAPTYHVDSKNLLPSTFPGQEYYPSQSAHTPLTHQPVRAYVVDYSTGDDIPPEFVPSARHSMSSYGNDSPATPQSVPAENVENSYNGNSEVKKPNGHIQLFRTESQAYQDELYNPPTTFSSTPAVNKPASAYLSPHRNIISERLQTANMARSQSPTSAGTARERSPFRDHSPLAPTGDWRTPAAMGTAAGMRQQQKDQAAQAEYARTMPPLQREPTKTISPKDALLDYNDQEQSSLFQESIPQGYKQHNTGTGTEPWPTNGFVGQPGSSFGNLQTSQPDTTFANPAAFNFEAMPATTGFESNVLSATSYPMATYNAAPKQNSYLAASDANPQFPATLTSMDSSISDNPPSSAEVADASIPRRPADTRANTGTYTCTYHGCTQRFETPGNLQKHKRDYHRAQTQQLHQQQREASASSSRHSGSSSPVRSTVSPAPSGSGMTSAALQARNSQAGPHKCTRINPSTGKPCNTIFSRPYDLTRHEDTIHNGRKQKVRCPMCREEKTFSRNDALTRHMRVVHPEVENFGKRSRRD